MYRKVLATSKKIPVSSFFVSFLFVIVDIILVYDIVTKVWTFILSEKICSEMMKFLFSTLCVPPKSQFEWKKNSLTSYNFMFIEKF